MWSVFVGSVVAKSLDQGAGGIISYSIKSLAAKRYFHINNSGAIFTKAKLDHEIQSKFELTVEARDHGVPPLFGYVNVTVFVIDINDNFPVWDDYTHCIELVENHPVRDKVHDFNASDKDSGVNGKVMYSIVSGPNSVFHLNAETGSLSLINAVDYEKVQSYNLIVNASDSGHPALWSLLNVEICVTDVNDNVPVLNHSSINVSENLPVRTVIYTFRAVDKDSGDNGKVWYTFSGGVQYTNFDLSGDGNLTLKSPLNRETQDKHELYILAGDRGIPMQTSTPTRFTIYVEDVNDEAPTFLKKFSFSTIENEMPGTFIGKVEAIDGDLGKNSEIVYSLVNSTDHFEN